ncbi:MAG: DUF6304 family protein [Anaerolineae bacterium]
MIVNYPAKYRDSLGEEITTIQNDGKLLRMEIREVAFVGEDFDSLEPTTFDEEQKELFDFVSVFIATHVTGNIPDAGREAYMLSNYQLECEIPLVVVVGNEEREAQLYVQLDLRNQDVRGDTPLLLRLSYDTKSVTSSGRHSFFDSELSDIQRSLPTDVFIKTCISCRYADFGPYQGTFGALGCYRNNKEEYLQMKASWTPEKKWDLLKTITESVQETYLCSEFQPIKRG